MQPEHFRPKMRIQQDSIGELRSSLHDLPGEEDNSPFINSHRLPRRTSMASYEPHDPRGLLVTSQILTRKGRSCRGSSLIDEAASSMLATQTSGHGTSTVTCDRPMAWSVRWQKPKGPTREHQACSRQVSSRRSLRPASCRELTVAQKLAASRDASRARIPVLDECQPSLWAWEMTSGTGALCA